MPPLKNNLVTRLRNFIGQERLLIVVIVGFAGGVAGGVLGSTVWDDKSPLLSDNATQTVLEESSAIIEVSRKLKPSVVSVVTEATVTDAFGNTSMQTIGAASGIIISADGLILTNKHVVEETGARVRVTTSDNREFTNAKVLSRDPLNDLAYLKIKATGLEAAELGDSDQVVVGQRVVAIGNALGEFANTVTSGIVSGIGRPVTATNGAAESEALQDLIQTDAAINPGNSGGPLVNIEGQVIGINTAVAGEAENIGFAIPVNQAKSGIASINKTGRLQKPFLGVRFTSLDKDLARSRNLEIEEGALVQAVIKNSPAQKAGIREGDVITHISGQAIATERSLTTLIGNHSVGDEIELTFVRDNQERRVRLTLTELPRS